MRLLKLFLATALCLSVSITVSAHPGRTDADGGHYNRDTGEYHYHHGEPAHQHTDKDGDGILECPYRINGSLDSSKSENKNSATIRNDDASNKEEAKMPSEKKDSSSKKKISFEGIMWIVFAVVIGVGFVADLISDAIKRKRKQ